MPTFQERRFSRDRSPRGGGGEGGGPRRGFGRRDFQRGRDQRGYGAPPAQGAGFAHHAEEERPETPGPHITRVVVPGEKLADAAKPTQFAFIEAGRTYSSIMGLYDETDGRLVPLEGCYLPNVSDYIVGVVKDVKFAGYNLEINSPYIGFLSNKETREEFELGDIIVAKVLDVDEVKNVHLTDASKLEGGEILEVLSVKIPRIIGKRSSMINMVQDATKSEIVVGKNGRIWLRGGNSGLAAAAILKIAREAHIPGLTDRIAGLLNVSVPAQQPAHQPPVQQGPPAQPPERNEEGV